MSPASLTFTPANWDVFQEFSVTGLQDSVEEPDIHSVSGKGHGMCPCLSSHPVKEGRHPGVDERKGVAGRIAGFD